MNTLEKDKNPLILSSYGLNSTTTVFYKDSFGIE